MFSIIKTFFTHVYEKITTQLSALFNVSLINDALFVELERVLISADTGVSTTHTIIKKLKEVAHQQSLQTGAQLKIALRDILATILGSFPTVEPQSRVYIMVGINGSGKTTFAAKLAVYHKSKGKRVLLVAADTFRAAAVQQLMGWADRYAIDIVTGTQGQDPAAVVFNGCQKFLIDRYDILIIDTAGRLHTKVNLMNELAKIGRIIEKKLPYEKISILLTVDSMLGQNSFEQVKLFKECASLTGIVLTKMDGTSKGGIIFSIIDQLHIPIVYSSFGESPEQFALFDAQIYLDALLP